MATIKKLTPNNQLELLATLRTLGLLRKDLVTVGGEEVPSLNDKGRRLFDAYESMLSQGYLTGTSNQHFTLPESW